MPFFSLQHFFTKSPTYWHKFSFFRLSKLINWSLKQDWPWLTTVAFVVLITIFSRLYLLGQVPAGLTWDEASLGYVGQMVIQTGSDEHRDFLPTTFVSFGDYKAPLAFYLTGVSSSIFGVNPWSTRFPFAIVGIFAVGTFGWISFKLLQNKWLGLLGATLFALSPWHFLFSRIAFESGLSLWFVLLMLLSWINWHRLESDSANWSAKISFFLLPVWAALSIYAYHSARLVTPLLILTMLTHDWLHHRSLLRKHAKLVFQNIVWFLVLLFPYLRDIWLGTALTRAAQTTILASDKPILVLKQIIINYGRHLDFDFLLSGSNSTLRHGTAKYGVFLLAQLILFWLGLSFVLGRTWQRFSQFLSPDRWQRLRHWLKINSTYQPSIVQSWFWLVWLMIGLLPAAIGFEIPHANRAILALPAFLYLMLLGVKELQTEVSKLPFASIIGCLILFMFLQWSLFWNYFFNEYNVQSSPEWMSTYPQVVSIARQHLDSGQKVKLTSYYGQPLIFYAYYNHLSFEDYRNFSVPNLSLGPITIADLNYFDILIAADPTETLPISGHQITNLNGQPAFIIYENEL